MFDLEKDLPNVALAMELAGSDNPAEADEGFKALATVYEGPVRENIFPGNQFQDLFGVESWDEAEVVYYYTSLIQPDKEADFKAYGVPAHGMPATNFASPGRFVVPTFEVENAVSVLKKDLRLKRFDTLNQAMTALWEGLTWKMNDDCWAAVVAAAVANGSIQQDASAAVGQLSKGLINNLKIHFERATKSNPTSKNGFKLTRLYLSPEAHASLAYLTNADLDDVSRREIITDEDGRVAGFMGVTFHSLTGFGTTGQNGADYQAAMVAAGGVLPGSKTQFVIGVDGRKAKDKLKMPVVQKPTITEDPIMPRRNERSWFVQTEYGVIVLDPRVIRAGAL